MNLIDLITYVVFFVSGFGLGVALDFFYATKILKTKHGDLNNDGESWTNEDQAIWMRKRFTLNHPNKNKDKEIRTKK